MISTLTGRKIRQVERVDKTCFHAWLAYLNGMLERLQAIWRSWRERRRQYQLDRALYKAGGHGSARDGGHERRAKPDTAVQQRPLGRQRPKAA